MYVRALAGRLLALHHFRQHPLTPQPCVSKEPVSTPGRLGSFQIADQSLWVDVETEAREGKKLVQGHAASSSQRFRRETSLFGDSRGEKGLMGLGERRQMIRLT